MIKNIYSILVLTLCATTVFPQSYYFTHLQVEDGLSQNSVICMLQDRRGFMWFGTKDGLNRYDGYRFKIFQHISGDTTSIGSNFIRCLYEYNNFLWVGTDTGLFRYDERNESFTRVEASRNRPIRDVVGCGENLWFIAAGALFKVGDGSEGKKTEKYEPFDARLLAAAKGDLYVATENELYKFIPENNSFNNINFELKGTGERASITAINAQLSNPVLIGTKSHGAFALDLSGHTAKPIISAKENPLFIRNFLVKSENEIWIATESGLFIYDKKENSCQNSKKNYADPYSLSDNAIYTVVQDKEGGIWVGTYFGGVNYYPKQYTPITRYFPQPGKNSIRGNAVREIKKDSFGNLWIGTEDDGLNKLNLKTGKFENYSAGKVNGNLSNYNIHGLLPRGKELWIGTFEHGLDIFDIKLGKVVKHYGTGKGKGNLKSDFVFYIYETRAHDVYILTSSGVHRYTPQTDSFEVVAGFPERHHYTCLLEDHEGTLWAGTYWDGLYFFNPDTKEKGFYRHEIDSPESLSSNVISSIFQDSKKRLWVTTENGLNVLNPKTKKFRRYTKADGFPANISYAILEDRHQKLWISTSNGLVKFDPEGSYVKVYTKSDGLLSDQFNYCSAFQDSTGEMYFGSVKGLISFNPTQFVQPAFSPPLYISNITINNKRVSIGKEDSPLRKSIVFSNEIILNNNQSTFTLEFSSLSFSSNRMTQYWYKMEGLNSNWVSLGKNHEISFTELAAGDYVFSVKAQDGHGVWTMGNGSLAIKILPPFYASKTAWFIYLLLLLLIVFCLLQYYHHYTKEKNNQRIVELENEKEKEIYHAKIEFFTNVAHEIRTPLTLINNALARLVEQKYKAPEIAKNLGIVDKNTSQLLNLINELLDFRRIEKKHIRLSFVQLNIGEVLEDTFGRFSHLIQDKELKFEMTRKTDEVLAFVDEDAFQKIISNLLINAIKYARKKVVICLEAGKTNFQVTVKNDGEIIPVHLRKKIFEPFFRMATDQESNGSGIGLSLALSLAELHHGIVRMDEQETEMNTFVLDLPIHQDVEFKAMKVSPSAGSSLKLNGTIKFDKEAPLILVAEDKTELAEFLWNELNVKYNVVLARNGEEAIKLLAVNDVQLIISDILMPVKNGMEFCREIKEGEKTSHIPVILLTARSTLNAQLEGLECGADAYITKPFSIDYLMVQIANLIKNRKNILSHFSNSPLAHLKSLATANDERSFLAKLDKAIEANLKDHDLSVDKLAAYMNMSRSTLYRSIRETSKLSPNELINNSRLKKAAYLIKTTHIKIYEVAEAVGYKSQTNFGRKFQKYFGMTPTEFEKINTAGMGEL